MIYGGDRLKNIYVSLMNAYDETKNINYNNLEKLLDYHKEIGNYNYFIGQYFFEKWSLSQKEKTKLNELIINKLDNEAKIIIDVSDAVYEKNLTIIND